jgi:hypothetical protein
MWVILFFMALVQAAPELDYGVFKASIEPLLLEKRPGHARCVVCHSTGTAFRLQPLAAGAKAWSEEQTQKNFEMVKRFVLPGVPTKSRLLTMPLAAEAGGVAFHPGGKHWETQNDPEWKMLADWVNGKKP